MLVKWLPRALRDIEVIFDLIEPENRAAALRILDKFEQAGVHLSRFPHLGRPGRVEGTREYVISGTPYIMPYRVVNGEVQILRVYHAARRWPDDF